MIKRVEIKRLIYYVIIYIIPLIVLFVEVSNSWSLIFTLNHFNIRTISPIKVILGDINSPGVVTEPLEMQIVYLIEGIIIYSIIYIFNSSPSAIFPISEILLGYVSFVLLFHFQKNLFLLNNIKHRNTLIFIEIGSLFFILSRIVTNSFGNLSLASVNALFFFLLTSKYLLTKDTKLNLIFYSLVSSVSLIFIETDYLPLLPAIFIPFVLLFNRNNYKRLLKYYGLTLFFFSVISLQITLFFFNTLVSAKNPLILSLSISKTPLSPPSFQSVYLAFNDIFYTLYYSPSESMFRFNALLLPLVLLVLSIIIDDNNKIKPILLKILLFIIIIITLYSSIYFNKPIIEILTNVYGIHLLFYVLNNYRIPTFIVTLLYSLAISLSLTSLYMKSESSKIFHNNKRKILGLSLLVLIGVLPTINEAYIFYPLFNSDFSSPGNVAFISTADTCAAYWIYTHDENNGLVIWLPYYSYPKGPGYVFHFNGPNVIIFPLGSDGPSSSWFFDYIFYYVPTTYNSYIFAKLLSLAGIEYIIINRNYTGSYYTLSGNTYYNLIHNSSYFTLVFHINNIYIYKNNLFKDNLSGLLGYDFSGLYGEVVLLQFTQYDPLLNLITPIEADMVPMPNPLIYRGVLIFNPYMNMTLYVIASLIFSNETLENKTVIIKPYDFNYTNLFFNTNVYPFFDYSSLYQFSYNINYGYLINLGQMREYTTNFSVTPGKYVVLIRYLNTYNVSGKITIDNSSYILPSSILSPPGFNWYAFEVNINRTVNTLTLELQPSEGINLILFVNIHEYYQLLAQSIKILKSYPIIYDGILSKGEKISFQWLKNSTSVYIDPTNGPSKIIITINNTKSISYIIKNVTNLSFSNVSSLSLETNSSILFILISGNVNSSTPTIAISKIFTYPSHTVKIYGYNWITYPYMGISTIYVLDNIVYSFENSYQDSSLRIGLVKEQYHIQKFYILYFINKFLIN